MFTIFFSNKTHFSIQTLFLLSTTLLLLLLRSADAGRAYKGDPGELGDFGLDLSQYDNHEKIAKSRKKRFVNFPSKSTLTFNNKLKIPLIKAFDGEISE